jgi:hypothetical protein
LQYDAILRDICEGVVQRIGAVPLEYIMACDEVCEVFADRLVETCGEEAVTEDTGFETDDDTVPDLMVVVVIL